MNSFLRKLKDDPVRDEVINIAWPVFIELMLGTLFGMVDMMMLGQLPNAAVAAASIAAVGITNQPVFIGLSLVQALNVGGTALISRYVGSKEYHKVEDTFRHILLLAFCIFALPLSILGFTFAEKIMVFMGAQPDTVILGLPYFRIIMIGFLFQSVTFSITAALRGTGNTKTPMRVNLIANFCNVIGNAVLIFGLFGIPPLGVVGAALSTAICNLIGMILMIRVLSKSSRLIKLDFSKPFHLDTNIMKNIIKIGIPASLEQLALRVGILIFTKIVTSLGTTVYAAHQIALSILGLSFNPGQAFGIAASTMVGKNLGAKQPEHAEKCVHSAVLLGRVVAIFMSFLLFFFGPAICRLYSSDPEIIRLTSGALKIIALVQPFQSSQLIIAGGLRGAGDTLWTLIATFAGILGVRIGLAYFFVLQMGWGLLGAWAAVVFDQLLRSAIITLRFKSNKWKTIKIK